MLQVSPRSPLEDQAQPHRRIQKLSKTPDATADTMLLSNLSTEPDQAHIGLAAPIGAVLIEAAANNAAVIGITIAAVECAPLDTDYTYERCR